MLQSVPELLRKRPPFRRLMGSLALTDVARRVTDPFYIVFATDVLGVPVSLAGAYLSVFIASKIVANVMWEWVARRFGNARVLQLSALASIVAPASALAFSLRPTSGAPAGYVFSLVFVAMGFRDSGRYVGKRSVFLDIVPEEGRPLYWGSLNTLLGVVGLLPVLAGAAIDGLGYAVAFAAVSGVAVLGLWTSMRIRSPVVAVTE